MQNYVVELSSESSKTFRCVKAANSLDIDVEKKLFRKISVDVDVESAFNVGLIVGSSGSGKTTLAKKMFGNNCFDFEIDESLPVIDQFPKNMSYEECQEALNSIGLSQVTCWIRPVYKALVKCPQWTLMDVRRFTPSGTINLKRTTGFRNAVKTYSFKYTPERATTS